MQSLESRPSPLPRFRIGAYVLAADPTWIRSSVGSYYRLLEVLVVSASADNTGWTGRPVLADQCVSIIESMDTRGIVKVVRGRWLAPDSPMDEETAQRRNALAACGTELDWVLQIDTDEVLPSTDALLALLAEAERRGIDAVEWPMRVLYRRLRDGRYLQVVGLDGAPHYEYPGPIAVRPTATLVHARRVDGAFLRPVIAGDRHSLQVARPAEQGEIRVDGLHYEDAILHNSWARSPGDVRRKVSSWGHNQGIRTRVYYYATWLPAKYRWRWMRDFHPMAKGLWPRLAPLSGQLSALLDPADH